MSVTPVSSSTSATTTEKPATSKNQTGMEGLGQDAFMTLLLEQMKNQDPLKPLEDKDFIAQLAQFNSLSQLTQLNKTMSELMSTQTLAQGSSLIGKTVSGLSSDGNTITGLVSGLRLVGGKVTLDVDGRDMSMDMVNSVQS